MAKLLVRLLVELALAQHPVQQKLITAYFGHEIARESNGAGFLLTQHHFVIKHGVQNHLGTAGGNAAMPHDVATSTSLTLAKRLS